MRLVLLLFLVTGPFITSTTLAKSQSHGLLIFSQPYCGVLRVEGMYRKFLIKGMIDFRVREYPKVYSKYHDKVNKVLLNTIYTVMEGKAYKVVKGKRTNKRVTLKDYLNRIGVKYKWAGGVKDCWLDPGQQFIRDEINEHEGVLKQPKSFYTGIIIKPRKPEEDCV